MASVHGREVVGSLASLLAEAFDVLTVNENTDGQDRIMTADKMDEGRESTEKVEKTGKLQEGLLGLHQKMDQLLEALCERPVARYTSSFAGRPRPTGSRLCRAPMGQHTVTGGGPL